MTLRMIAQWPIMRHLVGLHRCHMTDLSARVYKLVLRYFPFTSSFECIDGRSIVIFLWLSTEFYFAAQAFRGTGIPIEIYRPDVAPDTVIGIFERVLEYIVQLYQVYLLRDLCELRSFETIAVVWGCFRLWRLSSRLRLLLLAGFYSWSVDWDLLGSRHLYLSTFS